MFAYGALTWPVSLRQKLVYYNHRFGALGVAFLQRTSFDQLGTHRGEIVRSHFAIQCIVPKTLLRRWLAFYGVTLRISFGEKRCIRDEGRGDNARLRPELVDDATIKRTNFGVGVVLGLRQGKNRDQHVI